MALSINYTVDPDTVILKLYRETGKEIDLKNLPLDQVTLDKTKSTYTYPSSFVQDRTHYSFVIEATDVSGNKIYSSIQNQIHFDNPGPGCPIVQRGRYDFGVMDVLTNEEFGASVGVIITDLISSLPQRSGEFEESTRWYKCLVDKKIVFIPVGDTGIAGPIMSSSLPTYVNDYVKNGLFGSADPLSFDGCPELYKKGYSYQYRTAKFWLGEEFPDIFSDYSPEDCTLEDNEVSMIFNLLVRDNPGDGTPGIYPTIGLNVPSFVAGDVDLEVRVLILPGVYRRVLDYSRYFDKNEKYISSYVSRNETIFGLRPVVLELLD